MDVFDSWAVRVLVAVWGGDLVDCVVPVAGRVAVVVLEGREERVATFVGGEEGLGAGDLVLLGVAIAVLLSWAEEVGVLLVVCVRVDVREGGCVLD